MVGEATFTSFNIQHSTFNIQNYLSPRPTYPQVIHMAS